MGITHINPWDDGPDPNEVKKRIEQYRKRLCTKVKRSGLYENFGQKEVRKLWDEFGIVQTDPEVRRMINEFDDWCGSYTGG